MKDNRKKGNFYYIALPLLAAILWGSTFPVSKTVVNLIPPFLLAGIRFILASFMILPFIGFKNFITFLKKNFKFVFIIGLFQSFIQYALFFTALKNLPAAKASIIIGTSPIIAMIGAHIFLKNDKFTTKKSISIIIGISGAIIISLSKSTWINGESNFFEIILMFLSMLSSAIATILIAKKAKKVNPFYLNAGQLLIGGTILITLAILSGQYKNASFSILSCSLIAELSFVSAIAFSIWFYLLKKVKVTSLNIWKSFIPVTGTTFSWVFLKNESFNIIILIGMILVVFSIIVMNYSFKRK